MNVLLVNEDLFNPEKENVIYERFINKCKMDGIDALCISITSSRYLEQIEKFKDKYGGRYPIVLGNNIDLKIYDDKYPLKADGIYLTENDIIYSVDDAVCEIEFYRSKEPKYRYIPLDVFTNMRSAETEQQNAMRVNGLNLLNGQPIAIPLQKFLEIMEEHIDDETKEKLKKVKQDINGKNRS